MGTRWRLAFLPNSSGSRAQHCTSMKPKGVPCTLKASVECRCSPCGPCAVEPIGPRPRWPHAPCSSGCSCPAPPARPARHAGVLAWLGSAVAATCPSWCARDPGIGTPPWSWPGSNTPGSGWPSGAHRNPWPSSASAPAVAHRAARSHRTPALPSPAARALAALPWVRPPYPRCPAGYFASGGANWIDPDVLVRAQRCVCTILPATTLRLTQMAPIGRPIAGAAVTGAVHEGLHQHRGDCIACLPIRAQPLERQGQCVRGQVRDLHARQDQKAAVGHHLGQPRASSGIVPANPLVARRQAPRRGA